MARLRIGLVAAAVAAVASWAPAPTGAQAGGGPRGASPFADRRAEQLWASAADHRQRVEDALVQYVAVVKERVAAALRMPLKDRTLYRAESAGRVVWTRGGTTVVQVLGGREQVPVGPLRAVERPGVLDVAFEPLHDRLFFGMAASEEADRDDVWFEHPLAPGWRDGYRFSTGDSLTLSLPDGRGLQAVELEVVPVEADVHRMVGSLWIEPETGALVRAVYRLSRTFDAFRDLPELREEEDDDLRHVPEILKPVTLDLSLVAVDYAWWEGNVWLPRSLRAEGTARAGVLKAPATVELSYHVESVVTEADLAARTAGLQARPEERHFATRSGAMAFLAGELGEGVPYRFERGSTSTRDTSRGRTTVRYLVPEDSLWLVESPHLPPPVWENGPGFPDPEEVASWQDALRDLPTPPELATPWTFRWGLQRTDLLRYNRVEGLSVGARAQLRPHTPLGPLSLTATARVGTADPVPRVRLDATRETLARRITASVYHELAAVDGDARHLGLGNSVTAFLFGRDDGDYYRRSGASLSWTPPSARRRAFRLRGWAEHHRAVGSETDFALWHLADDALSFRDNLQAREGWEMGGEFVLTPWWGTDPRLAQGGVELSVQGAGGDWEYARASLEGRVAVPLPAKLRLGLEAGGGTSWGDPPPQRRFLLGGARSLRGYPPGVVGGTTYLRGRAELARHYPFGAVSLFSDAAWGAEERRWVDADEVFSSVGVGLSLVDGLIRLDGAWGLREPRAFRLELYLDGIL